MELTEQLLSAYRNARYCVYPDNGFGPQKFPEVINIVLGDQNKQMSRLLAQYHLTQGAIVTACNPQSQILSEQQNSLRQEQLIKYIQSLNYPFLGALNRDPENIWPDEPAVLVLGIDSASAMLLAKTFDQHAFVQISQKNNELVLVK